MADYTETLEKLRELEQLALKDKDLDDRLRLDRKAVFAEMGIDVDQAEEAISQIREDRVAIWGDVLDFLDAKGSEKSK